MKYNKFLNKEQEMRNPGVASAFGSILGMDLHTSDVNPLPTKMHLRSDLENRISVLANDASSIVYIP